jgi:hypothetical protein
METGPRTRCAWRALALLLIAGLHLPAEAAPGAGAIVERAKRDVGQIDRALREGSQAPDQHTISLAPAGFERTMAAAFRERGPARIEEDILADGTRRSRRGIMCMAKQHNGLVGARDVFRDGIKTESKTCPR